MSDIGLYKRPKSSKFQCKFTINGELFPRSTDETDRTRALQKAKDLRDEMLGVDLSQLTYAYACERFFAAMEGQLKPRTLAAYRSSMTNVHEHFGNFVLDKITSENLDNFVRLRMQTPIVLKNNRVRQPSRGPSIRRDFAFMSSLYTFARRLPGGRPITRCASMRNHISRKPKRDRAGAGRRRSRKSWMHAHMTGSD